MKEEGGQPLSFVASCKNKVDVNEIVKNIRKNLCLEKNWHQYVKHMNDAFSFLKSKCQDIGILVMMNGIVGGNTRRKLDVHEFRAFVLVDLYAPLIFINTCDSQGGKIFSLLHEVVHLYLGVNNIFNESEFRRETVTGIEQICNQAAAELLVPMDSFTENWKGKNADDDINKIMDLAKKFHCSPAVVARRALDIGYIGNMTYQKTIGILIKQYENSVKNKASGGNYYKTLGRRLDYRFVNAVENSVKNGRISCTEAYRLTNTSRKTFDKMVKQLQGGVNFHE